jgi:hypothetical protein
MRVAVLAGNYQQFRLFCDETGFLPDHYIWRDSRDREWQAVFVDDECYRLRGYRYDAYIRYGTWWTRSMYTQAFFNCEKAMREHKNNARRK